MAEEIAKGSRVRMFVALDLPETVRRGIATWGEAALDDPALRPVRAESLHITLAFLGLRPETDVEGVAAAMESCAAPAPVVELLDPVPRPSRGRPRLFALPVVSPGTELIQAQLAELLAAERLYEHEKRPFWPHVTVARVRPERRGSRRPAAVESPPESLPGALKELQFCRRLSLYRSVLQPKGARYVPLAQVKLP